jgi:predicted acyl esterase
MSFTVHKDVMVAMRDGVELATVDQRPAEARDDVLCFTSDVLTEPLEVTGHVSLTLFASSSAPDTDFTGKLVDVFPTGGPSS